MKRLFLTLVTLFLTSPVFATQDARELTIEQRIALQETYRIPWIPTERKWINTKLIGADEKPFVVVILLYPDQACAMIPDQKDQVRCYWHWQFLPETPRDIHDNEAIVRLGPYFAWVTEQEYCDMVKGTHQMSSPKLDVICRESWMEFFQTRDDLPDAMKIMVYPF